MGTSDPDVILNCYRPITVTVPNNTNEPDMTEVMNTLRILSNPSIGRMKSHVGTTSPLHTRCPNCKGAITVQQGPRSRDDILRNLGQLERTLKARGEELPSWVKAYKEGDSVKAAKLLHLTYMGNRCNVRILKRGIVQEATSTTTEQDNVHEEISETGDGDSNVVSNKRIRLVSLEK